MSRYQFPSAGTTDASLLVSGTLSDARLSSNVALENLANVFSAKQSFSGVDHVGLCLNSLTTAQYNALTATNGDLYRDSTTDRIDARLARGTVELVDTAGGQTINGAISAQGTILARNGSTVGTNEMRLSHNGTNGVIQCSNGLMQLVDPVGTVMIQMAADSSSLQLGSNSVAIERTGNTRLRMTATTMNFGWTGLTVGYASATQMEINNGTTGTLRDLSLRNITASGTVTGNTFMVGDSTGPLLRNNAGTIEARNNANSAASNFNCAQVTAENAVRTSTINRLNGDATLAIYNANMGVGAHCITIPGSSGALTNSTGVAGYLRIVSIVNQTGTAGSTDFLINRTETALGSGSHNFLDFQVGGSSRFSVSNAGNLTASGTVRLGTFTVGTLPSASANTRARAFVTDSNLTFNSTNLGATVTAGGAILVPVFSNGTNWVIG